MTAPATTGPKSDPRTTSSTPATSLAPDAHASFSYLSVQRSRLSRRSLAVSREPSLSGRACVRLATSTMLAQFALCAQEENREPYFQDAEGSSPGWELHSTLTTMHVMSSCCGVDPTNKFTSAII